MSKKEVKKNRRIVRDMKECFRSFYLPVNEVESPHVDQLNVVFMSQLCNDHVCAAVFVTHDNLNAYVGISVNFHLKVPAERMVEMMRLLNLLNENNDLYGYSICKCCNGVSMQTSLYLPHGSLPVDKFKRLIHEMLEDTYLCFPLMLELINGGNPENVFDQFIIDHQGILSTEGNIQQKANSSVLGVMKSVLTELQIPIKEEECRDDGFVMDCRLSGVNFPLRMAITSWNERRLVTLTLGAQFVVPEEKIPVMMDLVTRLNKNSGPSHLHILRQTNRVVLNAGLMVVNGALDKKEFETSVRTLLGNGSLYFPVIHEQLSSNDSPEVLMEKFKEKCQQKHKKP